MIRSTLLLATGCALTSATFAQGDTCGTATPLAGVTIVAFDTTPATTSGFNGGGNCIAAGSSAINQDLFWQWTAGAAGTYRFSTCGSAYDTMISVHRGVGCAANCELFNDDFCGLQSTVDVVNVNAGDTFLIQIGGYAATFGTGTLSISSIVTPPPPPVITCATTGDDMFEENDNCPTAVPMVDGAYLDLAVLAADNDFFAVDVPAGNLLSVDIYFSDAEADLDLYFWDPTIACDTNIVGVGAATGFLARGFSASDNEFVSWANTTGATVHVILEIDWYAAGTGTCNNYHMVISGSGPGSVGAPFCTALANSTGAPSTLEFNRPPVVGDTALQWTIAPLPNNSFGFAIMSMTTVPPISVSAGNLCLGGAIWRYQQTIGNSGLNGAVTQALPWSALPTTIAAGDTWSFQYWHRDTNGAGGAVSNFSEGRTVTFQ